MQNPPAWQLPVQWPNARAGERPAERAALKSRTWTVQAAIVLAMLALTVLDRFGLKVSSEFSVPASLMAVYALAGAMVLSGAARLDPRGAPAFLAAASVVALSFLVNAAFEPRRYVSIHSLALLLIVYAPFALSLRPGAVAAGLWRWTLRLFIAFSVFIALAGIAQFFAQFVFRADWLFDFAPLLPERLRASGGWNTVYPVGDWIKSNGFFLREPSMFSILMAFALVCELSLAARKGVIAILGTALVLSYSGSGLLCLGAALLFTFSRRALLQAVVLGGIAAGAVILFGDALNLSYMVERATEFGDPRTSSYCRFIHPGAATLQNLDAHAWTALLGNGPGTMVRMGGTCPDLHQPTYGKLLFEYGFAGMLAFGALVFGALGRSAAPVRVRVAAGTAWLLLSGLFSVEILLFITLISAMWPAGAAVSPGARR